MQFETKFNALVPPVVNLNGSPRQVLVEQYHEVAKAMDDLLTKMGLAMRHGRDYQTDSTGTYIVQARAAHTERMMAVVTMAREYEALAISIAFEQGNRDMEKDIDIGTILVDKIKAENESHYGPDYISYPYVSGFLTSVINVLAMRHPEIVKTIKDVYIDQMK